MAKHFQRELANIKKMVLSLGALVEERVLKVIQAVENKDPDLAQQIIKMDYEIDEMEVEVEEECCTNLLPWTFDFLLRSSKSTMNSNGSVTSP
jgi:phosphate uptake regulator